MKSFDLIPEDVINVVIDTFPLADVDSKDVLNNLLQKRMLKDDDFADKMMGTLWDEAVDRFYDECVERAKIKALDDVDPDDLFKKATKPKKVHVINIEADSIEEALDAIEDILKGRTDNEQ